MPATEENRRSTQCVIPTPQDYYNERYEQYSMSEALQTTIQVLHVDDEPNFADLTATFLERESDRFAVETTPSPDEGLTIVTDCPPDCVVSDYNMPRMDGIEFLETVRDTHAELPFILFTGKGSEDVASDALRADATDYIQK